MTKTCPECDKAFETNRKTREYCGYRCSNSVIAKNREAKKLDVSLKTVWSCGGGIQSTAMAILICKGMLPKPDYAIMTDCGWERQSTWDYVNNVIIPKLREIDLPLQIIRTTDYGDNDLYDNNHLIIPAYRRDRDRVIKFKTHCSNKWKVKPVKRWLKMQGIQRCENWIGISADEARRMKQSGYKWFQLRYPLIELDMDRAECLWTIGNADWPQPQRTSCLMCPHQNDKAWQLMRKTYPEDWARALEIEEEMRKRDPDIYLHRSLRPLNEAIN